MTKKISYFHKNGRYLIMKDGIPTSLTKEELNTHLTKNNCETIK